MNYIRCSVEEILMGKSFQCLFDLIKMVQLKFIHYHPKRITTPLKVFASLTRQMIIQIAKEYAIRASCNVKTAMIFML